MHDVIKSEVSIHASEHKYKLIINGQTRHLLPPRRTNDADHEIKLSGDG